ncbi:TPA: DegV family protein [Streptococcus equi subsp. zooepidemicus]|nr:DegV family protein [Streptococcus equi subsp. zooepidemicus]HEL1330137.1 DegV family protein [Streptococcus equi subsp. zooepidemicus]
MTWKIVSDSGCDIRTLSSQSNSLSFERVPLTLQIGADIFRDDDGLDIDQMMETMYQSSKPATSSCPSPDAFLQAYRGADNVIAITITGTLSGSHNSARLAQNDLLEENPNANIHVIDSLSAGGEMDLIVLELERLINQGLSFDEVVEKITAYQEKTRLVFVLAKVDNLVKNGRLNKLIGKVIGLLNIRMVGQASKEGTLELLQKARGQKKAVSAVLEEIQKAGYKGGRVFISHAKNPKICEQIAEKIRAIYPEAEIQTGPASGLCSFYAEAEGLLMGYEV